MSDQLPKREVHEDSQGNQYVKDAQGNLYIRYQDEEGNRKTAVISDFQEGDYGLWVANDAPYFLEGDYIVERSTGKKAKKEKVLKKEENKFLEAENRIKNGYLWIHDGEEIVFPAEEEKSETKQESKTDKSNNSSQKTNSKAAKTETSQANSSEDSSKSGESGSGSGGGAGSGVAAGKSYVVSGAKLKCSFGTEKSELKVAASHNICIQDNMIASMQDYKPLVNIFPFGKCKSMSNPTVASATAANNGVLKPMPCQPNIVAPWMNAKMDLLIADNPALVESSKCTCTYGGVITVDDPGQDIVET